MMVTRRSHPWVWGVAASDKFVSEMVARGQLHNDLEMDKLFDYYCQIM